MPSHRVYVEPFGGVASVLLRKPRCFVEFYNDLDDDVVNLFQILRGPDVEKLAEQLRLTPYSKTEFRNAFEWTDDPLERARRCLIKGSMGFGSWASAKQTPGATGFREYCRDQNLAKSFKMLPEIMGQFTNRLRDVVITKSDAWTVMERHDSSETLHFLDPPYLPQTRDIGKDYAHELTVADHETLLKNIKTLSGMVMLSGYASDLYEDYLGDWRRIERAALADGARKRTEVLWMNFEAQIEAQEDLLDYMTKSYACRGRHEPPAGVRLPSGQKEVSKI